MYLLANSFIQKYLLITYCVTCILLDVGGIQKSWLPQRLHISEGGQ